MAFVIRAISVEQAKNFVCLTLGLTTQASGFELCIQFPFLVCGGMKLEPFRNTVSLPQTTIIFIKFFLQNVSNAEFESNGTINNDYGCIIAQQDAFEERMNVLLTQFFRLYLIVM